MHIVFAADGGFLRQLLVSSGSAVYASRKGRRPLCVHVLDCGISKDGWAWYASQMNALSARCGVRVELCRHTIDMARFAHLPGWTNGSKAIWARILIPELLESVDACVYSDCDVLFVADPTEMLGTLSPEVLLAGHRNPFGEKGPDARWHLKKGLPYDANAYVCTGLVAMNLAGMRESGIVRACFDFASRHPDVVSNDQTALNNACRGKTAILPDGWGLFTHECHCFDGCIKAIHFSGGWPWARCKNVYDALCWGRTREESSLWRAFETKILGLDPSVAETPSAGRRALAWGVLSVCRLANRLNVAIPGRACLQELVAAYDGRSPALAHAKEELLTCFADRGAWQTAHCPIVV